MKSKILSERTLLIVALGGLALLPALLVCFVPRNSIQDGHSPFIENVVALPKQKESIFGLPVRLKIPVINVDAAVEYVGLTAEEAMDMPKSPENVAWFELGSRPGENGAAVIAGHYGRKNGKPSVFDDLYKLREGDKLYVENDKGEIISFVVRKSRRYAPSANGSGVFSSSDGKAHLNLITCEGVWDEVSKSYPARLVVFADKE